MKRKIILFALCILMLSSLFAMSAAAYGADRVFPGAGSAAAAEREEYGYTDTRESLKESEDGGIRETLEEFLKGEPGGTTVAKIGETEYASLQEAIDDVEDGETITLLADAGTADIMDTEASFSIDATDAGYTYIVTGAYAGADGVTIKGYSTAGIDYSHLSATVGNTTAYSRITAYVSAGAAITSATATVFVYAYLPAAFMRVGASYKYLHLRVDNDSLIPDCYGFEFYIMRHSYAFNGTIAKTGYDVILTVDEAADKITVTPKRIYITVSNEDGVTNYYANGFADANAAASGDGEASTITMVYGTNSVLADAIVAADDALVINSDVTMTLNTGVSLTVDGTLTNNGVIKMNRGSVLKVKEALAVAPTLAETGYVLQTTAEGGYTVYSLGVVDGEALFRANVADEWAAYPTLNQALTAAKSAAGGGYVQLQKNIYSAVNLTTSTSGKTVAIDLNGYKLSMTGGSYLDASSGITIFATTSASKAQDSYGNEIGNTVEGGNNSNGLLYCKYQGSVTVKGGVTLNYVGTMAAIIANGSDAVKAKVIIENGAFVNATGSTAYGIMVDRRSSASDTANAYVEVAGKSFGDWCGVYVNGSVKADSVTVTVKEGAEISGNDYGMYLPAVATYNIEGGAITGRTAIYQRGGTLNISGGELIATGPKTAYDSSSAGETGDALVVDSSGFAPIAAITGGTFISANAAAVAGYTADGISVDPDIEISGGLFSSDVTTYCADNYAAVPNGDGLYRIVAINAAQIGAVKYETLKAAVAAVKSGETVLLLVDAAGDGIVVPSGTNFTLDLGGHTYTVDGQLVGSPGTETLGFQLLRDSDITIQNGAITTTKAKMLIQNYSNLTLDDVDLTGAAMTQYVLSNNNGATTLTNKTTITAAEGQVAFDVYYWPKNGYPSVSVEIATNDVVITGWVEYASDGSDGFAENARLTIPAGYILAAPEGYKWVAEGGKQVLKAVTYVAQVGAVKYESLAAALAGSGSGDTVALLTDAEVAATLKVAGHRTLDLNGHTLTGTTAADPIFQLASYDFTVIDTGESKGKIAAHKCAFEVITGTGISQTTLTISAEVTVESATDCCIFIYSNSAASAAKAEVYGTLISKGQYATIQGHGNDKSPLTAINIYEGASVTSENSGAIYQPGKGLLNISGGTITAAGTAIEVKGGTVTISSGTVSTTATTTSHTTNGSGSSASGYAFAAVDNIGYTGATVAISSGVFSGPVAMLDDDADANNNTNTIAISGGRFDDPVPEAYCAAGYIPTELEGGKYGVKNGAYLAQIGAVKYETLKAAVAAVKSGETVLLLVDAAGDGIVVPSGTNFTLDLGGHTYTVDGQLVGSPGTETLGFQLLRDSDITIQNGAITTTKAKMLIQNYSNLTLDDVDLTGAAMTQYVLSNNNGATTLTNKTTITAAEGQVAFDVYYWPKNGYPSVSVEIATNDVVITGRVEYASDGSDGFAENARLTIPAGYTLTPPDGYKWVTGEDGKQVLTAVPAGLTITGTITGWNDNDTKIYLYSASMTDLEIRQDIKGASPTGIAADKGSVTVKADDSRLYDQTYAFTEVAGEAGYKLAIYRKGHGIHVETVDAATAASPLDSTVYLWGDVNMDGEVNIGDATLLRRYLVEATTLTDRQLYEIADVIIDGVVNIGDATRLRQYIVEAIPSLD